MLEEVIFPSILRLFLILVVVFVRFWRGYGILFCNSGTPELVLIQGNQGTEPWPVNLGYLGCRNGIGI